MPTHDLTPDQIAARRARVVDMRRQRRTWDAIAAELDVTPQRAGQIYRDALAAWPVASLAEHRAEEGELIDLAVRRLMAVAIDATVTPRTRVEAWSAVRGWSEHRARLFGLNAPTKSQVDVVTRDSFAAEMEALAAELGEAPAAPALDDAGADVLRDVGLPRG